jgi:hypothetical protein
MKAIITIEIEDDKECIDEDALRIIDKAKEIARVTEAHWSNDT